MEIDEARKLLSAWVSTWGITREFRPPDSIAVDASYAIETVFEWSRGWEAPKRTSDQLSIFAPSLHRRTTDAAAPDSGSMPPHYDRWLSEIVHLSLFVDHIWVPDPAELVARALDDILWPKLSVHAFIDNSQQASEAFVAMRALQPLVKAGIVRYYPPLTLYETGVSDELFGTFRDFTPFELATAWPEGFVAEGLAYADALDATYVGLEREELDALTGAARDLREQAGVTDARIVAALPSLQLPYFEKLGPETLAAVRTNEQAFEDFRELLREVIRELPAGAESPMFDREVRRFEKDALNPAIKKLLEDVRGITTLRECLSTAGTDFAAAALVGAASTGNLIAGLPTGAISVLSKMLVKRMVKPSKTRPAGSVVLSFHTGRAPRRGLLSSPRRWF